MEKETVQYYRKGTALYSLSTKFEVVQGTIDKVVFKEVGDDVEVTYALDIKGIDRMIQLPAEVVFPTVEELKEFIIKKIDQSTNEHGT